MTNSVLEIHGRKVEYNGEQCGIYKDASDCLGVYRYARMDVASLCLRINSMAPEQVSISVRALYEMAVQQAAWKNTPDSFGAPILRGPAPLEVGTEEREGIRNLQKLCERILAVFPLKAS
jgi:hypothetical protein